MICGGRQDPRNLAPECNFKLSQAATKLVPQQYKRKASRPDRIKSAFLCSMNFTKIFQNYFKDK